MSLHAWTAASCAPSHSSLESRRRDREGPSRQQQIDWSDWLRRWDAQQEGYVPEREARFAAMFDVLAELLPASFVALDLASGPGSIVGGCSPVPRRASDRRGHRSGDARHRTGALGTEDGRLRWIEADLASPTGSRRGRNADRRGAQYHRAALAGAGTVGRLYHDLARVLRPGGLFLNGDDMAFSPACRPSRA